MQIVAAPVGEGRGGGDGNGAEDTGANSTCKKFFLGMARLWRRWKYLKEWGKNPHPLSP